MLVLAGIFHDLGKAFDDSVVNAGKLPELFLLLSFLVTWAFIRTSAHMIKAQVSWWPGNVETKGGLHIHHMVWGICAMLIVGYLTIAFYPPSPWREVLAVFFGIGMGLTLDEFALWLNLKDVYWEKEGRESVDAVVVVGVFALLLLMGLRAWTDLGRDVEEVARFALGLGGLSIAVATVNVLKGKYFVAVGGLVIPLIGLIGVFRLARPDSLYARWFYGPPKRERARARSAGRGLAEQSAPGGA